MDEIPVEHIRDFEIGLYKFADLDDYVLKTIISKKDIDTELEEKIKQLIVDYKVTLDYLTK